MRWRPSAGQGFEPRKLLTDAATGHAVLDQLEELSGTLASRDTLVISYLGHGGQLPDDNKEEDDGLDETWPLRGAIAGRRTLPRLSASSPSRLTRQRALRVYLTTFSGRFDTSRRRATESA